jgi:hypothetical protein
MGLFDKGGFYQGIVLEYFRSTAPCNRNKGHTFFIDLKKNLPNSRKNIPVILTERLREYAPPYATPQNWVAQLKRGDFPPVMHLVLYDPKQ